MKILWKYLWFHYYSFIYVIKKKIKWKTQENKIILFQEKQTKKLAELPLNTSSSVRHIRLHKVYVFAIQDTIFILIMNHSNTRNISSW